MKMRIKLIDTENFLNMPVSTRCLYFELLHRIDERNVCTNLAKVLKRVTYAQDDIVILIEKEFGGDSSGRYKTSSIKTKMA